MYKLEYLSVAKQDMVDIAMYISHELSNPTAAEKLINKIIKAANQLIDSPYIYRVHYPIRQLKYEYRKVIAQNYLIFYFVSEEKKLLTVARVIYTRRNYENLL
jgi:plasmid stabilization system protein ParE